MHAAFTFWKTSWRKVLPVLVIAALGSAAYEGALAAHQGGWAIVAYLIYIVAGLMAQGALLRLALAGDQPQDREFRIGPGGVQWRASEWRLLGVTLSLVFVLFVVFFLVALAVGIFVGVQVARSGIEPDPSDPKTLMAAIGPAGLAVLGFAYVVVLGLVVWIGVRLFLASAATVASRRIVVFDSWRLTRGHSWQIFGSLFLIALPIVLLSVAAAVLSALMHVNAFGLNIVVLVLAVVFVLPMTAGLMAYFYRRLATEPVEAF